MANIKSAKKRIKVAKRNEARNKSTKSKVKTYIKKVEQAAASGNKDEATKLLKEATKHINKANIFSYIFNCFINWYKIMHGQIL